MLTITRDMGVSVLVVSLMEDTEVEEIAGKKKTKKQINIPETKPRTSFTSVDENEGETTRWWWWWRWRW